MSGYDFDIAHQVSTIASTVKDSNPRWICVPNGYYETNNGSDWCDDCGYYIMRHLRRKDRKHKQDYLLDGGWRVESDHQSFCAHCGCHLRISLTNYGVEEELLFYRENGVGINNVIYEAYSLDVLLDAVSWGSEHIDEVIALARDLVALPAAQAILSEPHP